MESRRLGQHSLALALVALLCPASASADAMTLCPTAPELAYTIVAPECTEGATQKTCIWKFEYRDEAAEFLFKQMQSEYAQCPGFLGFESDAPVNHPDTSLASILSFETHRLRISFKDKSALGLTIVTWQRETR